LWGHTAKPDERPRDATRSGSWQHRRIGVSAVRGIPRCFRRQHAPWHVTTKGDLPDDVEHRQHDASGPAWHDYAGRILDLEILDYVRAGEDGQYGRRWACELTRGIERITVTIERTA
jgi:hypothetical protein